MTKLLQITEPDLATLEELLPPLLERLQSAETELCQGKSGYSQNELRAKMRRIQEVLVNVRWRYGPSTIVDIIPAGPNDSDS